VRDAERAEGPAAERAELFGAALSLWRGDAFADVPEPIVFAAETAWLDGLCREAEECWFEACLDAGLARRVLPDLERAVLAAPVRERVHRAMVRALADIGRPADALRAAGAARARMVDETGIEPGPALAERERQILRSLDGAPAAVQPVSPAGPRRPARPARPLDRFVGRQRESSELAAAVAEHRVVTVTGPGGVGKSRLVAEWAAATGQPGAVFATVAPMPARPR
jgi:hypothetical protein